MYEEEVHIEDSIRLLLANYRESKNLIVRFDEGLSHLLSAALQKYELTQSTKGEFNSESFS